MKAYESMNDRDNYSGVPIVLHFEYFLAGEVLSNEVPFWINTKMKKNDSNIKVQLCIHNHYQYFEEFDTDPGHLVIPVKKPFR